MLGEIRRDEGSLSWNPRRLAADLRLARDNPRNPLLNLRNIFLADRRGPCTTARASEHFSWRDTLRLRNPR